MERGLSVKSELIIQIETIESIVNNDAKTK